jgi:hypothetical protein
MTERISVTEVARNFADFISRVAYRRERFVLVRGRRDVAELRPLPDTRRLGDLARLLSKLPALSDEEAVLFKEDMDRMRDELPPLNGL